MSRFAYVGSYGPPNGTGTGITVYRLDSKTTWQPIQTIVTASPSFLCLNRSRTRLYVVNELNEFDGETGTISAFQVDPQTGLLTDLNVRSARGYLPCHLVLDQQEKNLLVANYGNGTILVCPLSPEDQSLEDTEHAQLIQHQGSGPNKSRQEGPHAHMIYFLNDEVLVPDLGLDKVVFYNYVDGKLTPSGRVCKVESGSGPRHVAANLDGRFLFVINELKSTVSVFSTSVADKQDSTGNGETSLQHLQTLSTLPAESQSAAGSSGCAAIVLHSNGRFLYGSNRGDDSITVFAVDGSSGRLTVVGHQKTLGKTPRHFEIDDSGHFLYVANQDSNSIVIFKIDQKTGLLSTTGDVIHVPSPVSTAFL